ncbi:RNA-metabolising metallo-beta-lactamase [Staphylococcus massiliensis CCUG 55927]|nr:RNA-metabolising metallo-beta-lactamase [Staphylococcus massiliensis CCUG 55927]
MRMFLLFFFTNFNLLPPHHLPRRYMNSFYIIS